MLYSLTPVYCQKETNQRSQELVHSFCDQRPTDTSISASCFELKLCMILSKKPVAIITKSVKFISILNLQIISLSKGG